MSLLLNMNGTSFEDVGPTAGRYGSVDICASIWFILPHQGPGLICSFNWPIDLLRCANFCPFRRIIWFYHHG